MEFSANQAISMCLASFAVGISLCNVVYVSVFLLQNRHNKRRKRNNQKALQNMTTLDIIVDGARQAIGGIASASKEVEKSKVESNNEVPLE